MSNSQWKKRLFDQICETLGSDLGTKRKCSENLSKSENTPVMAGPTWTQVHKVFTCPQCLARQLEPCPAGVRCPGCNLDISLDYSPELTIETIQRMLAMARSQHRCVTRKTLEWPSHILITSISNCSNASSRVSTTVLNQLVFLTWTCGGCGEMEILL